MKKCIVLCLLSLSITALAQDDYLKKEDQQYYQNDILEGKNTRERIDSTVKEINKLHGELASLRSEMALMKKEIQALKAQPKK